MNGISRAGSLKENRRYEEPAATPLGIHDVADAMNMQNPFIDERFIKGKKQRYFRQIVGQDYSV